jgi:hypothetical protein
MSVGTQTQRAAQKKTEKKIGEEHRRSGMEGVRSAERGKNSRRGTCS